MQHSSLQQIVLLFSAFMVAICGLVYELLAGTLSSYLLGDSVYQFSLVIGLFMSAMGIGAWASRFIEKELPSNFVKLQLLIGLLGGITAPVLFFAFAILDNYTAILFLLVTLLGSLLGIEIPLIIRILKNHFSLKVNLSNVFTADYIGALIAALLFPLVLVPQLGLLQTGFLFGLLNIAIGFLAFYVFRHDIEHPKPLLLFALALTLTLSIGFWQSENYTQHIENKLYQQEIIHAQDTSYQQRLVITHQNQRIRFFINGALQFDSFDEYRYHESLIHPAMSLSPKPENVLILGGGDGLAVREILKYDVVKNITLVDLDPAVTSLFKKNERLASLNQHALSHEKVNILNQDAWKFLENVQQLFDVIIVDLPDPNNPSLSRLYTNTFYKLIKQRLSRYGIVVTQATSPLYARKAFWSIQKTMSDAWQGQGNVLPYHTYVPSFGEWGFVMATQQPISNKKIPLKPELDLRYLNTQVINNAFHFSPDIDTLNVDINRLSDHVLLKYYQDGWAHWYQ